MLGGEGPGVKRFKVTIGAEGGRSVEVGQDVFPKGVFGLRRGMTYCPISTCSFRGRRLKAHVHEYHLPAAFNIFLDPAFYSQQQTIRVEVLELLSEWVFGPQGTIERLYRWVQAEFRHPEAELAGYGPAARSLALSQGEVPPREFTFSPRINSVGLLLHWRVLLFILCHVSQRDREALLRAYPR